MHQEQGNIIDSRLQNGAVAADIASLIERCPVLEFYYTIGNPMLLPLMYHNVGADRFSNPVDIFRDHLFYIQQHFNIVWPGEPLVTDRPNVVLTFDDASYNFYYYVFPLLKEFNVRAMVNVPVRFILEDDANVETDTRLSISVFQAMRGEIYKQAVPFCTWKELREMGASGLVRFASHTTRHVNLLQTATYEDEMTESKFVLQEKLGQPIDAIALPYGEFNKEILIAARRHYRYIFAVGGGDNRSWEGIDGVIFRLYGDELPDPISIFDKRHMRRYARSYYKLRLKKWIKDRQKLVPRD